MKMDILELIKSTCQLKSSLIDLIKKHYLIIWLTNTITKLQQDAGDKLYEEQNNKNLELLYKLIEISILIWTRITESSSNSQIKTTPPALFIAQLFSVLKVSLECFSKFTTNPSPAHEYLYQALFSVFDEVLTQTRLINENQSNCLSTYCLTEIDLKRLFRLRANKSLEKLNEVQMNYLYVLVGLLQDESYLKELSRQFLIQNTKFILSFISNNDKIRVFSKNEIKFKNVFKAIHNLLNYFNSETQQQFDSYYDTFYEISINITEFLLNLNNFKHLNLDCFQFCEVFKKFLLKIKNEEDRQIDLYDDKNRLFLNENCYSILVG